MPPTEKLSNGARLHKYVNYGVEPDEDYEVYILLDYYSRPGISDEIRNGPFRPEYNYARVKVKYLYDLEGFRCHVGTILWSINMVYHYDGIAQWAKESFRNEYLRCGVTYAIGVHNTQEDKPGYIYTKVKPIKTNVDLDELVQRLAKVKSEKPTHFALIWHHYSPFWNTPTPAPDVLAKRIRSISHDLQLPIFFVERREFFMPEKMERLPVDDTKGPMAKVTWLDTRGETAEPVRDLVRDFPGMADAFLEDAEALLSQAATFGDTLPADVDDHQAGAPRAITPQAVTSQAGTPQVLTPETANLNDHQAFTTQAANAAQAANTSAPHPLASGQTINGGPNAGTAAMLNDIQTSILPALNHEEGLELIKSLKDYQNAAIQWAKTQDKNSGFIGMMKDIVVDHTKELMSIAKKVEEPQKLYESLMIEIKARCANIEDTCANVRARVHDRDNYFTTGAGAPLANRIPSLHSNGGEPPRFTTTHNMPGLAMVYQRLLTSHQAAPSSDPTQATIAGGNASGPVTANELPILASRGNVKEKEPAKTSVDAKGKGKKLATIKGKEGRKRVRAEFEKGADIEDLPRAGRHETVERSDELGVWGPDAACQPPSAADAWRSARRGGYVNYAESQAGQRNKAAAPKTVPAKAPPAKRTRQSRAFNQAKVPIKDTIDEDANDDVDWPGSIDDKDEDYHEDSLSDWTDGDEINPR